MTKLPRPEHSRQIAGSALSGINQISTGQIITLVAFGAHPGELKVHGSSITNERPSPIRVGNAATCPVK